MCIICCQWSNIALGASVMEAATAGEFVASNPRIGILPILTYISFAPIIVWWFKKVVHNCIPLQYRYTVHQFSKKTNLSLKLIDQLTYLDYVLWYILFGLFWFCALCIAIQKFVSKVNFKNSSPMPLPACIRLHVVLLRTELDKEATIPMMLQVK